MRAALFIAIALLLGGAGAAAAAEFVPGWSVDGVYDSNVLNAPVGQEDPDESVRTGPNLRLRKQTGDVTYDVNGQIRYEAFVHNSSLDTNRYQDLDYFLNGEGGWRITDRTRLSISENYAASSSLAPILETIPVTAAQVTTFIPRRERIKTNTAAAVLSHRLGPLWEVSGQLQQNFYNYPDNISTDTSDFLGEGQITRSISRRLVIGAGGHAERQIFEHAAFDGSDTGTNFYQGFGVLQYRFSPTMALTMNAGPAWSVPDSTGNTSQTVDYRAVNPATCQTDVDGAAVFDPRQFRGGCQQAQWRLPFGGGELAVPITPGFASAPIQTITSVPFQGKKISGQLSYFGKINLSKNWRTWTASAGLSRSASNSSGFSGSSIVSAATADLSWNPNPLWFVSFSGIYTQQVAANKIPEQITVLDPSTGVVADQAFDVVDYVLGFAVPCTPPGGRCQVFTADPVAVPREIRTGKDLSNSISVISWRVELHAERQLSRNLSLQGTASYWRQKVENDLTPSRETETFRFLVGFTWTFDPIPLPLPL